MSATLLRRLDVSDELDGSEPAAPAAAPAVLPYLLALLVVTLTYWTIDIVAPALPEIKDDLALSATGAGLVFSVMFFGRLLGNFPATWLLGRAGASRTALAGGAMLAAASALAAAAPSSEILLLARILQGAGISLAVNAGLRSIMQSRPARGAAMTWFGLAATVGGIFGLQSGGILTDATGWRSIFALSAALAVAVAGVALVSSRRSRETAQAGAASGELETGFAGTRALVEPLVLNFVVFANYSIWIALPLYAEREFDAGPNSTANLLMIITVVHLIAAIPVGASIARFGSDRILVAGMAVSLAGTMTVLAAPGLLWMTIPLVLYGVGQVAAVNAGGDIVLQRGAGSSQAIGLLRLSSDVGLVIGPIVAGAMADAFGYGAPFAALPVVMASAGVAAVYRLMMRPDTQAKQREPGRKGAVR